MDGQTDSWSLLVGGCLFFPGLFFFFKRTLTQLGCNHGDATTASARAVSAVQAIMASSAGVIIVTSCEDVMRDRHWLSESYVVFATPYFVFDIYTMFLCYRHRLQVKGHEGGVGVGGYLRRELLLVLHHLFMVLACCPASLFCRQGRGDFFQGLLFLAELSTPFVCLGKVLIQFQQQKTLLHKLNGALMILVFFCCRVLLFPYMYLTYSRYLRVPLLRVPLEVPWPCNLGAGLLMALQVHWFLLICRGALRLLLRPATP
ncbi:ceramide synthase-like [Gadus morhua]|uniref:ceramide synthase-like n=1 Tax=Gadus morhua TaxID=8049 RepID=UPI0011B6E3C5|nr:ceramide synthase-like [Gadus morhua]